MSTGLAERTLTRDVRSPITEGTFEREVEEEIRDLGDILAGGWAAGSHCAFPDSRDKEALVAVVLAVAGSRME